ncbi:MAG: hypothetical protein M1151_01100 [Candidatus Thermoplasmatota archaeon]|jgi:hypothetical protein|nr:hypothetical protein [Candidatus Thermoplasmatota archaeon]MCL5785251.1 hypothetical protein [Candidatus Thermoplasmatota archaeon]
MIRYGTQEYFDELKAMLNADVKFRELGKGCYYAKELVVVKDLGIGIWQATSDGEVGEMRIIAKREVPQYEQRSDLIYYVNDFGTMSRISRGEESFVSMVIDDRIVVKGSLKAAMKFQGALERMEDIVKQLTLKSLTPTEIQYRKWAGEKGYI